jgi:hypothetical protein
MVRRPEGPAVWTLRVDGHLDDHWSTWFSGLALTREGDGTTRLTGVVTDQAAVHGLLTKIRDLGLTLVSAEAAEAAGARQPAKHGAVREEGVVEEAADAGAPRRDAEATSTHESAASRGAYPQRAPRQPH